MAIKKSLEEHICVDGNREEWLKIINNALDISDFTKVNCDKTLYQVKADYKKLTTWGEIIITLTPSSTSNTKTDITIKSTANVDNIYAIFKSPNKTIIKEFKDALNIVRKKIL